MHTIYLNSVYKVNLYLVFMYFQASLVRNFKPMITFQQLQLHHGLGVVSNHQVYAYFLVHRFFWHFGIGSNKKRLVIELLKRYVQIHCSGNPEVGYILKWPSIPRITEWSQITIIWLIIAQSAISNVYHYHYHFHSHNSTVWARQEGRKSANGWLE